MNDFRAAAAEGLNLDPLIEGMAERVAARLQNGDQGVSVNGDVRPRPLTVERAAICTVAPKMLLPICRQSLVYILRSSPASLLSMRPQTGYALNERRCLN
jgi:hypothetical protein